MHSDRSNSSGPITTRVHSLGSFGNTDARGKHRIQAGVKRLEQEARFLEEELEQLDKMEKASAACKEMLGNVECKPDPLLPVTIGPINLLWERWFEGPQESKSCRCWM